MFCILNPQTKKNTSRGVACYAPTSKKKTKQSLKKSDCEYKTAVMAGCYFTIANFEKYSFSLVLVLSIAFIM